MSLYYSYKELLSDIPDNSPDFDLVDSLSDLTGEDLTKKLTKNWEDYSSKYLDESYSIKSGYITEFVLEDTLTKLDKNKNSSTQKLLEKITNEDFYLENEPYIGCLSQSDTKDLYDWLYDHNDLLSSKYYDLFMEILEEAVKKQVGLVIYAF